MTVTRYVRRTSASPLDDAVTGSKAGTLMRLSRAGFRVPDGFVVLTTALERVLAAGGIDADDSDVVHSVQSASIPEEVATEIDEVAAEFGATPLAVRSSAVDEDLEGRSYAGQYTSVLHVVGAERLRAAIRECWASAFSGGVRRYGGEDGASGPIAVLVQPMISAEAAGVAFSADPISGDRARARISAVRGVGDRLAEGSATPDEWYVDDEPIHESGSEGAIDVEQARSVAALAREVAENRGAPQDIEWAFSSGALWLLQARPITSLTVDHEQTATEVPDGFWRRSTGVPRPLSPMHRSVVLPILNGAVRRMFEFVVVGGVRFRTIGGWQYSNFQPLAGSEVPDRVDRILAADESDEPMTTVRRWYDEWQPDLRRRLEDHRRTENGALADEDLLRRLRQLREFAAETAETHFALVGAQQFVLGELGTSCRDLLGWDVSGVLDLVAGQQGKTTEPGHQLTELARHVAEHPELAGLIATTSAPGIEELARVDAVFAEEFAEYQRSYGQRVTGSDLDEPTPAERPELVLGLLDRSSTASGAAEGRNPRRERERALGEARSALAGQPQRRKAFDRTVERARLAYPTRDDTKFYYDAALALLRYCLLELGRRLAAREQVSTAEDVFLLEFDEAVQALSTSEQVAERVATRQREKDRARSVQVPAQYGTPPKPPPGGGSSSEQAPPNVRVALDKAMWAFGALHGATTASTSAHVTGVPASRGRRSGPVRIVRGESDFDKLRPGDVLVCPETSAQWSMLFPQVRALITDTGGVLSHPAIIAREYGIPAVLATGDATSKLDDGVLVVVDGDQGTVELA